MCPCSSVYRFFGCLCDTVVIQCKLMTDHSEDINKHFIYSFYSIVTKVQQLTAPRDVLAQQLARSEFLCQPGDTSYNILDSINCRRMYNGEEACEGNPYTCLGYTVVLTVPTCQFVCVKLLWVVESSSFHISYNNFGQSSSPVKDGKCPVNGGSAEIPPEIKVTTDDPREDTESEEYLSGVSPNTSTGAGHKMTTASRIEKTTSEARTEGIGNSFRLFAVIPGVSGGGLLLCVLFVILLSMYVRAKRNSPTPGDIPLSIPEVTSANPVLPGNENVMFPTVDDDIRHHESEANFGESDDEGYTMIQDILISDTDLRLAREERNCRPLPQRPDSRIATPAAPSTTLPPSTVFTDSSHNNSGCFKEKNDNNDNNSCIIGCISIIYNHSHIDKSQS